MITRVLTVTLSCDLCPKWNRINKGFLPSAKYVQSCERLGLAWWPRSQAPQGTSGVSTILVWSLIRIILWTVHLNCKNDSWHSLTPDGVFCLLSLGSPHLILWVLMRLVCEIQCLGGMPVGGRITQCQEDLLKE